MLQTNQTLLQEKLNDDFIPDTTIVDHMVKMGFHPEIVNMSLRYAVNNMNEAVDMLLRMQGEGTYDNLLTSICGSTSGAASSSTPTSLSSSADAAAVGNILRETLDNNEVAMAVSDVAIFC